LVDSAAVLAVGPDWVPTAANVRARGTPTGEHGPRSSTSCARSATTCGASNDEPGELEILCGDWTPRERHHEYDLTLQLSFGPGNLARVEVTIQRRESVVR
jgi:hypothetical protein